MVCTAPPGSVTRCGLIVVVDPSKGSNRLIHATLEGGGVDWKQERTIRLAAARRNNNDANEC